MRRFPESAVHSRKSSLRFADIAEEGTRRAARLRAKLGATQRVSVAIAKTNSPDYLIDLLAVLGAGHVPVLLDPQLSPPELLEVSARSGVHAVLTDDSGVEGVDRPSSVADSTLDPTTELCRSTSGSTRTPGVIEFSGEAVLGAANAWGAAADLSPADTTLCLAGLFNGLAFNTSLIPGLLAGTDLALTTGLPSGSSILAALERFTPTILVAFPAAFDSLARVLVHRDPAPGSLPTPRLSLSSAAPLSAGTAAELARRFAPINDYYGVAETGPVTFNDDPRRNDHGRPLPGVSLRVDDTGRVLVRTSSMGTRYTNYPGELEQRIDAEGFYHTADTGRLAEDGRLTLGGRIDRTLVVGGRKISYDELSEALRAHRSVTDCVPGVVVSNGVEVLAAVVETAVPVTRAEILGHLSNRLARYKIPSLLIVVPDLPRGGAGKVDRAAIQRILTADIDADVRD